MTQFKVGDRVIKARRYSDTQYCRYGGDQSAVPIGTVGTIIKIYRDNDVSVKFDQSRRWNLDKSELDLIKPPIIKTKNFIEYIKTEKPLVNSKRWSI